MSIKKIKKVLLSVVFFHLIFNSNSINASALDSKISLGDISSVNVIVPSEINVSFNADGTNTISEFAVTNDSLVPIIINTVNVKSLSSWELKPAETPILKDSKELVLQFNNQILELGENDLNQEISSKRTVSLPISISRGAWTYPIEKESAFKFAIDYSIGQSEFTLSLDYGNRLETKKVKNGAIEVLPTPERAGYKFTGWKAPDRDYQGGSNFTMPIGDYSLQAQWEDDNPAILVDGRSFNKILNKIITTNTNTITSIVFTNKAIPEGKRDAAELVSIENSDATANIYAYVDGDKIYVAPFTTDYNTYFNGNSSYMFSGLDSISSIIFSDNIKTSKVTNMEGMFKNCRKLKILDLSGWNTGKVTTMRDMFNTCSELTSANISNFDTSQVTDMGWMFHKDGKLTGEMTIMNPNTSGEGMFQLASGYSSSIFFLKYINDETKERAKNLVATKSYNSNVFLYEKEAWLVAGSSFNGEIPKNAQTIEFTDRVIPSEKIKNGIKVTVPNSPVRAYIWREDSNSTKYFVSPDVEGGKIVFNATSQSMFEYAKLENIIFNNIDTSRVISMERMFKDCTSLVSLENISNFNTENVTHMGGMFQDCKLLNNLDVSKFDTGNVGNMWGIFSGTKSLTSLDLSGWNIGKVQHMRRMFYGASELSAEITIRDSNPYNITEVFIGTSTADGARFVVKYDSDKSKVLAQNLVATKLGDENVILFEEYTITYHLNKGSNPANAPLTYNNIESNDITLPTPTRDGFEFDGWFTDVECKGEVVTAIKSGTTGNQTFYAKWTESASNQVGESEDQSESDSNKPNTEENETPNKPDIDNESNDTGGSIDNPSINENNPSTEEEEHTNKPDIDNESNDTGGSIDNPSTNENNPSTNEDNTTSGSDKNNPSENLEGNPNLGDSTDNSADSSVDIKKAMLNPYKHIKLLIVNLKKLTMRMT